MINAYLLIFFRTVVGLVFTMSLVGKMRDIPSFTQTITSFRFFPPFFSRPLTYLFLLGEFGVITIMGIGEPFLFWGFLAATMMFLSFSIALSSVLLRKIKTSCNCFGPDEKNVSVGHIVRSFGFMVCGIGGGVSTYKFGNFTTTLDFVEIFSVGVMGILFVTIWTYIGDLLRLIMPNES